MFSKNSDNEKLFEDWFKIYDKKLRGNLLMSGGESDQTSFMEALLESRSKIYVLPNDYNARLPYFANYNRPVKIVHGRHNDFEELRKKINQPQGYRCWHPQKELCLSKVKNISYYRQRLSKKVSTFMGNMSFKF